MLVNKTIMAVTDRFIRRPPRPLVLAIDKKDSVSIFFFQQCFLAALCDVAALNPQKQKTGTENSVAGFTIRSLIPVVTKLGCQFIASTTYYS